MALSNTGILRLKAGDRMMTIKIGDCFSITLPNGRYAHGQYLYLDDRKPDGHGSLVRIFDRITSEPLSVEQLQAAKELFPPVFVGLKAGIRSGHWRFIGHLPVKDFVFPTFRITNGHGPGTYEDWWIWDGNKKTFLGRLPEELRSLEVRCVWGSLLLEDRIATGKNHHELLH